MNGVGPKLKKAQSLARRGDREAAARLFNEILAAFPANRRAAQGLARLSLTTAGKGGVQQADVDAAMALLTRQGPAAALGRVTQLLKVDNGLRPLHDLRAACLHRLGRLEEARSAYGSIMRRFGRDASAWANLGIVLRDMNRLVEAEAAFAFATAAAPSKPAHWSRLGTSRIDMGRFQDAIGALERARRLAPSDPAIAMQLVTALRSAGQLEAAAALCEEVLEAAPRDPQALNGKGIIAQAMGETESARTAYAAALKVDPGRADVHRNLSAVTKYTRGHSHIAQMQAQLAKAPPRSPDAVLLTFALAKAMHDCGDVPRAAALWHDGNAAQKNLLRYSIEADRGLFALLSSLNIASVEDRARPTVRPIFVVGMPRSGTTLTEQILSSHPSVTGAGELPLVQNHCAPILHGCAANGTRDVTEEQVATLREELRGGLAQAAGGRPVVIDKMPLNFRYTGLIAEALPEAMFLHMSRDPVATCWSNYRHYFNARGNGFAYDLEDLAAYFRMHAEFMADCGVRWPGRIVTIDYEALTDAPENGIRDLLRAAELVWHDACLAPHRNRRAVMTASAGQVRRKIYRGASSEWKKYADYIGPLIDGLRADSSRPKAPARSIA